MSINEQCCANCLHYGYKGLEPIRTCLSKDQRNCYVKETDYCIFHVLDDNKKKQKKGTL